MENKPEWMNDPAVKNIPENKLEFLNELFSQSKGNTKNELLINLMPLLQKAKKENLNLTPEEMQIAISAIRRHSNTDEQAKIDKLLAKAKNKTT